MSSLAMFLLLCVSMHACTARHPRVIRAEDHHVIADCEESKVIELSPILVVPTRIQTQQQLVIENAAESAFETKTISGNKMNEKIALISTKGFKQTTIKIEDWEMHQTRKMLESTKQDNEENVDSKDEAGLAEDVVAMDYAQPHRKPPIHNEEH